MPPGIVLLSSWLVEKGYSYDLQRRYRKSKWLESIGSGAMTRSQDKVGYEGAVFALQLQAGSYIHPGAGTALSLSGKAHYLELDTAKITLFGGKDERLPNWFKKHDWGADIDFHPTSLLPADVGLIEIELKNFALKVSGAARAIMECLFLAPERMELTECYELMEGLNSLAPDKVQSLLEQCSSVKVKRLFLYMAENAGHQWFRHLDIKRIDLGKGKRSIVKNGIYVAKYQITVPKAFEKNEEGNL